MRQHGIMPLLIAIAMVMLLSSVNREEEMQKALPIGENSGFFAAWGLDENAFLEELVSSIGNQFANSQNGSGCSSEFVSSFMDFEFVFNVRNYRALEDDNLLEADNIRR